MFSVNKDDKSPLNRIAKALILILCVLFGFILARFFFFTYTVTDDSMNPNLIKGNKILILKITEPEIGDIILFNSPKEPGRVLLRRVASTSGDTIEIVNKQIFKNGNEMVLKWKVKRDDERLFPVKFSKRDNMDRLTMSENQFFVLCDDLDQAYDSRSFGPVDSKSIIGRLFYKF